MTPNLDAFQDFVSPVNTAFDDNGHGTEVSTIITGRLGAAPDARLVMLKAAVADGHTYANPVAAAINWAVDNRARYNIHVLNMSFDLDDTTEEACAPVKTALDRAVQAGMIPVVSAGNDGPSPDTLRTMAKWPHVITVASTDDHGTATRDDDTVADFSSRGAEVAVRHRAPTSPAATSTAVTPTKAEPRFPLRWSAAPSPTGCRPIRRCSSPTSNGLCSRAPVPSPASPRASLMQQQACASPSRKPTGESAPGHAHAGAHA